MIDQSIINNFYGLKIEIVEEGTYFVDHHGFKLVVMHDSVVFKDDKMFCTNIMYQKINDNIDGQKHTN